MVINVDVHFAINAVLLFSTRDMGEAVIPVVQFQSMLLPFSTQPLIPTLFITPNVPTIPQAYCLPVS